MKVKELIAKLQKVDPELEVLLSAESIHEKFAIIGIGRLTQEIIELEIKATWEL